MSVGVWLSCLLRAIFKNWCVFFCVIDLAFIIRPKSMCSHPKYGTCIDFNSCAEGLGYIYTQFATGVPPWALRDLSCSYPCFLYKRIANVMCHFCAAVDRLSEQLFCKRSCSLKLGLEITNGGCVPSRSQENKQRGPLCCATFNKHAVLVRALKENNTVPPATQ